MLGLKRKLWAAIKLDDYLDKFSKLPDSKRKAQYSLVAHYKPYHGYGAGLFGDIYFDTNHSFVLCKNRLPFITFFARPVAVIGFDLHGDFDQNNEKTDLIVKQIQGVQRYRHLVNGELKWERMLLAIVVDWAKKQKFRQVIVVKSQENHWYKENDKERAARMHMRYDVTPRRMGFRTDSVTGHNVLAIN